MTALTVDRNTSERDGKLLVLGMATATTIFAGSIVCRNAGGFATPGATAATLKALGRAEERAVNAGANGAVAVRIRKGVFRFANLGADLIAAADIGNDCFIVDDQTVAKTNGGATRSIAGKVFDVDAQGVWVEFA